MAKKKALAVRVNEKLCKRCGICVEFCAAAVFSKESPLIPSPERVEACTVCRLCEMRCPDYAVSVEEVVQS